MTITHEEFKKKIQELKEEEELKAKKKRIDEDYEKDIDAANQLAINTAILASIM